MLKNWHLTLLGVAILVVMAAIGYKFWGIQQAKKDIHSTAFNEFSGPADAPIELIEFVDYRCSACRRKHQDLQTLLKNNSDLKIIYRHYPVFGPQAADEAAMALGANAQGKFNEMHELLITREKPVKESDMPAILRELNMDYKQFMTQWRTPEIGAQIVKNMDNALLLGINSTPTFYLNNKRIGQGIQMPTLEEMQAAIDKAREKL